MSDLTYIADALQNHARARKAVEATRRRGPRSGSESSMTNLETTERESSAPTPAQLRAAMAPQVSMHDAAQLALGLLWMSPQTDPRVRRAYVALRDAFGGSSSCGLGAAIQMAMDAGFETDSPEQTARCMP